MSENRLYDAATRGDERLLEELLEQDPLLLHRVSYTCSNKTPLHVATTHGHLSFVRAILNHNPDLARELDFHQSLVLHVASSKGYLEIVRELLSAATDTSLSIDNLGRTPLHLAAMKGQVEVVAELVRVAPAAAQELDSHESSALHVASSKGFQKIAPALLSAAPEMCLSLDSRGKNPLHLAAMKGHVEVVAELVRVAPSAARVKLDRGMTVLHMCVEHGQLESLKILLHHMNELVNAKNDDGDTVLHMAVRDRNIEIVNSLLTVSTLEVNALNLNGLTPTNILSQGSRDARDSEIEEALKYAGGFSTLETNIQPLYINQNTVPPRALPPYNLHNEQNNSWEMLLKRQEIWLENERSALMVVASLTATMAFQVGVNPPGGVWQEDKDNYIQVAGYSILARNYPTGYARFYIVNTTSFIASLSIILLLVSGLPFRRRFFMWILMVITWIAITATALTYILGIVILTPDNGQAHLIAIVIGISVMVWICLMALLLIGHTVRLVVKVVRKLRKKWRKTRADAFVEREN